MADTTAPDSIPTLDVVIDPDFEPQKRPRSCTWPLPESIANKPEATDTDIIPEEEDDEEDSAMTINTNGEDQGSPGLMADGQHAAAAQDGAGSPLPSLSPGGAGSSGKPTGVVGAPGSQQQTPRKSSSRRNAWGNLSYADLITKAIESAPDKRLTLSQIYDWMVRSVPYFKDKGDSNSSAGWKVGVKKATAACVCMWRKRVRAKERVATLFVYPASRHHVKTITITEPMWRGGWRALLR
ncbi:hypothetical protein ACEWY4_021885 [Coilia grayii]|uniref:Fork-head domain-containing protein n=1 Tax=Coilia grayii TaxID=363190 RepID=A0ABD1J4G8_9TELE